VQVRQGWTEPANLFTVTALPPGERKSAVFAEAISPVQTFEAEEVARMAPKIAKLASERRILEERLKLAEKQAAKEESPEERAKLKVAATELAKELDAFKVPEPPQMYCDDETPESLGRLLAKQGGRILQASAEGTAFEIAKGRYSDVANFDVYLKGHAGDPLRTGRVGRDRETVDNPALSVVLAVQPDVIRGLAQEATMKGRGFLGRWCYSIPRSTVGGRKTRPQPVSESVRGAYHNNMLSLWRLPVPDAGMLAQVMHFDRVGDGHIAALESWLEPQLAEGERLSHLGGWANKLAGAVGRIAGFLHAAEAIGRGERPSLDVPAAVVAAAVQIGRDYLLPHAEAAFGLMGADERTEDAKRVLKWLSVNSVKSVEGVHVFSRREIHVGVFGGSRKVADLEPVLKLLADHNFVKTVKTVEESQNNGPGRKPSERYAVNPLAFIKCGPLSHNSQNSQNGDSWEGDE
jgi:hypothetical protein